MATVRQPTENHKARAGNPIIEAVKANNGSKTGSRRHRSMFVTDSVAAFRGKSTGCWVTVLNFAGLLVAAGR